MPVANAALDALTATRPGLLMRAKGEIKKGAGLKLQLMEEILHHLGCTKNPANSRIFTHPYQLVGWISEPSTVSLRMSIWTKVCHFLFSTRLPKITSTAQTPAIFIRSIYMCWWVFLNSIYWKTVIPSFLCRKSRSLVCKTPTCWVDDPMDILRYPMDYIPTQQVGIHELIIMLFIQDKPYLLVYPLSKSWEFPAPTYGHHQMPPSEVSLLWKGKALLGQQKSLFFKA